MVKKDWQHRLSQRRTSCHPLEVVTATMVVGTIEPGPLYPALKPSEQTLMSDMHSEGYLGLFPVSAKVTFAGQDPNQVTFFKRCEALHTLDTLSGGCFTVKFPVKRSPR